MELPGPAVDANRADDGIAGAQQPGDEQSIDQLNAGRFDCAPQQPAEFEPAAIRINHAREVEPAGRSPGITAVGRAMEIHSHRFEVFQPLVRTFQNFANQKLVCDAVIAGDDLAQNAVDVVVGKRDDHPGVGERGVAGPADCP